MIKSKLSKNGMITLPVEIRKQYNIAIGDEVGFIEIDNEYRIIPILKMDQLTNSEHLEATKKLIADMRKERANEA